MTAILAFSEILRGGGDMTEAERGHFSGVIHDEAVRLTRLLDDLLYLSVPEAGQVTLRPGAVDLDEVLDRAWAAARGTGALDLRRGPRLDDPVIVTDPDRLAQVVINLIGNAAKYCHAPVPRLTIETRARDESVAIEFIDTGAGVPQAQTALIFERFARAGDTQRAGGAGPGLVISREIMARPDGGDRLPARLRRDRVPVPRVPPGLGIARGAAEQARDSMFGKAIAPWWPHVRPNLPDMPMTQTSPLRRKIAPREATPGTGGIDPLKVWDRALVHGLLRAIDLEVRVTGSEVTAVLPEAVPALVPAHGLTLLLEGPDAFGVAILSQGVVSAMLDMQTIGHVQTRQDTARETTATDAALIADPLDRVLSARDTLVPEAAGGYRYALRIDNPRAIALSLGNGAHDCARLTLEMGPDGVKSGDVVVVLPRPPRPEVDTAVDPTWQGDLEARLMDAEIGLRADLARVSRSVGEIQSLAPGDILPLDIRALGEVRLVDAGGEVLCTGTLGQSRGRKAIRMGVLPELFERAGPPNDRRDLPT